MTVVLDSWAIMRLLENAEPAATRVREQINSGDCVMSWINLGEVYYVLHRAVGEREARSTVSDVETLVDPRLPDRELVLAAGRIKARYPMAYADSFAAATAVRFDATLWTGDPELLVADAEWRTYTPA